MKFHPVVLYGLLNWALASPLGDRSAVHHRRIAHIHKREVPQEHSHDFVLGITREFLNLDNPKGIEDVVFGLLGNAAAASGAGDVTNLDCLKQETADQAFTNAKAAKDLRGMAGALLFQALERNTGGVGVASVLCNETAVNPEIAALKQHQDPASPNAGALNKAITLELSKQLAAIGADPELALLSGTFAPGDPNDSTGAGNSCDDEEPKLGCIFSKGLLVLDASQDEISSAVAGVSQTFTGTGGIFASDLVDLASFSVASVTGKIDLATVTSAVTGGGKGATGVAVASSVVNASPSAEDDDDCLDEEVTTNAPAGAPPASAPPLATATITRVATNAAPGTLSTIVAAQTTNAVDTSGENIQVFTGTLGGEAPPVVSSTGDRPFSVDGDTFVGSGAALGRSCDRQHNSCANAANSGKLAGGVGQCDRQAAECRAANNLKKV
ncbi:hypothetical protein BGZ63DRAFT_406371 [Mariannaea sp. PMI_226]|nr:hypothetical protein BGZ63DRAFT_406371 [Mariannaea sp. PMI_226]